MKRKRWQLESLYVVLKRVLTNTVTAEAPGDVTDIPHPSAGPHVANVGASPRANHVSIGSPNPAGVGEGAGPAVGTEMTDAMEVAAPAAAAAATPTPPAPRVPHVVDFGSGAGTLTACHSSYHPAPTSYHPVSASCHRPLPASHHHWLTPFRTRFRVLRDLGGRGWPGRSHSTTAPHTGCGVRHRAVSLSCCSSSTEY